MYTNGYMYINAKEGHFNLVKGVSYLFRDSSGEMDGRNN